MTETAPPPIPRPKFAHWLWDRAVLLRDAAKALNCSYEQVRVICLPFDDPQRRVPKTELLEAIVAYTDGDIVAADFYPTHLTLRREADADVSGIPS